MSKLGLHVIGLALIVTAAQAAAQQTHIAAEGDTLTEVVSYADLNLSSPAGRERLSARVARAASSVCSTQKGFEPLSQVMRERRCRSTALLNARRDIDKAMARVGVRQVSGPTIIVAAR